MVETLGFLAVRKHEQHGYFGGYLILNERARPLEFHCTLPVQPKRAQCLLYGPTLEDFVCGEQIAKALVSKAKLKPNLILCDCRPLLALAHVTNLDVLCVTSPTMKRAADRTGQSELLSVPQSRLQTKDFDVGEVGFDCLRETPEGKLQELKSMLDDLANHFDFDEPFGRIIEALQEAHPTLKAA